MKLTNPGTVPVYTISGPSIARPLPEWLQRRRKRSRKREPETEGRFDVLQDFEFEEASICVRVSEDGNWIMSSGTYKPQFHVHSTAELSLSFARHTKSENVTFLLLGSDYTKSLHLQTDRSLEFHTPMGCHYETRLPRFGRHLAFVRETAEALIPAVGLASDGSGLGEVFRLNLEIGQFQRPFQVDVQDPMRLDDITSAGLQGGIDVGAVNVAALATTTHGLCAFGTSLGTVEFWDPRTRVRAAVLGGQDGEVSALDFSHDGVQIALGTSRGDISVFDLRSPRPIFRKNQGFGFPIKNILHLLTAVGERKLLSADKRIVKLWSEAEDGKLWTSFEPTVDLNFVTHVPDSGMILTANEGQQQCSMFIPGLGPAPPWCSFLNNLVNDMSTETTTETYTNFKFLTVSELSQLNLKHLIGKTNLLRPYMHGYFVDSKLYDQARLIANPYIWEEERAKRAKEKGTKEQANRIRGIKKVRVNQSLANKLIKRQENREKIDTNAGLLGDSRFSKLFQNEDFVVDETSREFRSLNPSTQVPGLDVSRPGNKNPDSSEGSSDEGDDNSDDPGEHKVNKRKDEDLVMKVSSSHSQGGRPRKDTSLGSRAQKSGRIEKRRENEAVGERQVTFIPERKKKVTAEAAQPTQPKRRLDGRRSASNNAFRRL